MNLNFTRINPFLRNINIYKCTSSFDTGFRRIYNYYLLYIHKGKGVYIIDETVYETSPGEIYFVKPGVKNRIIANKNDPFILSGIDFDFVQGYKNKTLNYPLSIKFFEEKHMTEHINFIDKVYFPDMILLSQNTKIQNLIYEMVDEYNNRNKFTQGILDGYLKTFLFLLAKEMFRNELPKHTASQIEKIINFIKENYNKSITNEYIAKHFNYNKDYLSRLIKKYTGIPLKDYIINLRINKAIFLLNNTNLPISQIAKQSGFSSSQYFSKMFKNKTGKLPSKYK